MNTSSSGSPSSSQLGSDPIDFAKLEEVARGALANKPHAQPWELVEGYSRQVKHANPWNKSVCGATEPEFALHIATFDPPTVLRLIELARVKS